MSDGGRVRIYLEWWELVVHSWDLSVMFSYFQFTAVNLLLNSLRPRPNRRHFADDIFRCIFENENEWISSRISLKFVPKVRINNIPALVQIMAWRRQGDKPLSEPMMVSLLTHICVTRPQWVKASKTCLSVLLSGIHSCNNESSILPIACSHRENHRSTDRGRQNTRRTGKPLYNHD